MPRTTSVGSCFGYEIDSSLPFSFLRSTDGGARLTISEDDNADDVAGEPTIEWLPRPLNELHARLYITPGGYRFWTDLEGWFRIDPGASVITVPRFVDPIRREERLWGIPTALCYLERGDRALHGAAVDIGGRVIVFAAPGGFGKTTLASAFLRAGHRVLSEDYTCIRLAPKPAVLPGPALLRIRRDVFGQLTLPDTRVVAEQPNRVHLAIDPDRRGGGDPVPLVGVILLRGSDDGTRLEDVPIDEALRDLWTLSFKLPTDEDRARCFDALVHLAGGIRVQNLYRPLRMDNLDEIIGLLVASHLSA